MDETYRPKSVIIFFLQICFRFFTTDDRLVFSPVLNMSEKHEASEKRRQMKAMFISYGIAIARARKPYQIGFLFADNNSYFGAITVTERSSIAPISKVVSRVSDRCSYYPADSCSCRQEKLFGEHSLGLLLFLNFTSIIVH